MDKHKHIELMINYLKDNNLKPFKMIEKDGLLQITEEYLKKFCENPIDDIVLINTDNIDKTKNGSISFEYQSVNIDYFVYHSNIKKELHQEDLNHFYIRDTNIITKKKYDNLIDKFKSIFNNKFKVRDASYISGYVFIKNKKNPEIPFNLELKRKIVSNNYYLILNV